MNTRNLNRRQFLGTSAVVSTAGTGFPDLIGSTAFAAAGSEAWPDDYWDPNRPYAAVSKSIRIQPILMYVVPVRKQATSWKGWGDIQTEQAAEAEAKRIDEELQALAKRAEFPMEVLPVIKVSSEEQARKAHSADAYVTIVYPATGGGNLLRACIPNQNTIIFVRHKSGPVYYWYEALSVRQLKTDKPETPNPADTRRITVHDAVVDDPDELLWRLRALHGVRNFLGSRILAVGGPIGKYAAEAPAVARDRFKFDIVEYP
jgi:hypothetical protein